MGWGRSSAASPWLAVPARITGRLRFQRRFRAVPQAQNHLASTPRRKDNQVIGGRLRRGWTPSGGAGGSLHGVSKHNTEAASC